MKIKIDKIYLDKNAANLPAAKIILKNLPSIPVIEIDDAEEFICSGNAGKSSEISEISENIPSEKSDSIFSENIGNSSGNLTSSEITDDLFTQKNNFHFIDTGKKNLLITIQKGRFFKLCPGTKNYLCCLYNIIHHASNCPMDCSYCILQMYFSNPYLMYFANEEDMFSELREAFQKSPEKIIRVGTGEFADSLALDKITEFSKRLIPFTQQFENVYLELKTKSVNIEYPLEFDGRGRVFMAWSVNPPELIDKEEISTSTMEERLSAAKKCQEAGFPVCLHFDPIVRFSGWEKAYSSVIEKIFTTIDASRIVWISMGAMRYPAQMKNIIKERFPESKILYDEFITGLDGKMRYFKPLRIEIFKHIYNEIRKYSRDVLVYFCMESEEIWREVFGSAPKNNAEFAKLLDERCKKFG